MLDACIIYVIIDAGATTDMGNNFIHRLRQTLLCMHGIARSVFWYTRGEEVGGGADWKIYV
jgi:hypothetical protein